MPLNVQLQTAAPELLLALQFVQSGERLPCCWPESRHSSSHLMLSGNGQVGKGRQWNHVQRLAALLQQIFHRSASFLGLDVHGLVLAVGSGSPSSLRGR